MGKFIRKAKREAAYYRVLAAHPDTPRAARRLIVCALIYLLTPIDLIPDWIPVLGVLDDLVIVPGLILAALVMIPPSVRKACRETSAQFTEGGEGPRGS